MTTPTDPAPHLDYDELMRRYGDVMVKFSSYYKYSFTFRGTTPEGGTISLSVGGDHNDIYRLEVSADPVALKTLSPKFVEITDKDGKTTGVYSDW